MAHKIQIRRGNKANLPTLNVGEFGLCQDTNELFIGNSGNQKIFPPTAPTISDVEGLQTALDGKVDDSQVLTNVPANAEFTDTVTTINGKTGAIAKSDITALGIPAQDTVYTHPATHSADMIVDGTTNKAFTATEKTKLGTIAENANNYTHPTTAGNKHIPTGGESNQILKYSASGTAVWADNIAVVNNLTEAVLGKALDATQGKILDEKKADKSTTVDKTLFAASWTGSAAPFSYSLTVTGVTSTSAQEYLPTTDITREQLTDLLNATIQDGGQSTDTVILKAFGAKPTIDIPIRVILRGDM